MAAGLEIERVWLLSGFPEIPASVLAQTERWEIEQGYLPLLADRAGEEFPEGRIRRIQTGDQRVICRHTIKRGTGIVREEIERDMEECEFMRLWPATLGRRITKRRWRMPVDGLLWELDVFHELPLVMLEVELPAEDTVISMPKWLQERVIREVSSDPRYRNAALAIEGIPASAEGPPCRPKETP